MRENGAKAPHPPISPHPLQPTPATETSLILFSFSHWTASILRVTGVFLKQMPAAHQAQCQLQNSCLTQNALGLWEQAVPVGLIQPVQLLHCLCKTSKSPAPLPSPCLTGAKDGTVSPSLFTRLLQQLLTAFSLSSTLTFEPEFTLENLMG